MWNCSDCGSDFDFPEVKRPDAGIVSGVGILGLKKYKPVEFCPECLSTKIRYQEKSEEYFTENEEGLINTVELAIDWGLPLTDELHDKYIELIHSGKKSILEKYT